MSAAIHLSVLRPEVAAALESTVTPWGSSRWKEWRRCKRAHWLRYTQGVHVRPRPADSGDDWDQDDVSYFDIGQICHSVLHYVQSAVIAERDPRGWAAVLDAAPSMGLDVGAVWEAERLMNAYWAHYGLDNAGWPDGVRLLGVEVPHDEAIGLLSHTGRVDTLLEVADELVVADTKTRSTAIPGCGTQSADTGRTAAWARGQATNPQFLSLSYLVRTAAFRKAAAAAMAAGLPPVELPPVPPVWVNAIVKTKIPQFNRVMVRPTHEALQQWALNQADQSIEFLDGEAAIARGEVPSMNYSECAPPIGTRCWAFNWCHGSDEERERYYEVRQAPQGEVQS